MKTNSPENIEPSIPTPDYYDYNDLENLYYPMKGNWFKRSNVNTMMKENENSIRRRALPYSLAKQQRRNRMKANQQKLGQKYYSIYSIPALKLTT